jgi:hypothetical protein
MQDEILRDDDAPVVSSTDLVSPDSNPYSPAKLFGVATLGATASLIVYAVIQSLDPEMRRNLRRTALEAARGQVRVWFSEE